MCSVYCRKSVQTKVDQILVRTQLNINMRLMLCDVDVGGGTQEVAHDSPFLCSHSKTFSVSPTMTSSTCTSSCPRDPALETRGQSTAPHSTVCVFVCFFIACSFVCVCVRVCSGSDSSSFNTADQLHTCNWIRSHLEEHSDTCLPKQDVYETYR